MAWFSATLLVFVAIGTAAAVDPPDLVYINSCKTGCAIRAGNDNALNRTSSIVERNYTFDAFAYSDDVLNAAVACARSTLAPFNVHVVMTDPGVARREVIVTTTSNGGIGVGGLSELAPYSGHTQPNTIAFVFASAWSGDIDGICWSIATVVGNLYALDRVDDCADIMAYNVCGVKSFTDANSACDGTAWGTPGHCGNGAATQNSYQILMSTAGAPDFILINSFEAFEVPHAGPSP